MEWIVLLLFGIVCWVCWALYEERRDKRNKISLAQYEILTLRNIVAEVELTRPQMIEQRRSKKVYRPRNKIRRRHNVIGETDEEL